MSSQLATTQEVEYEDEPLSPVDGIGEFASPRQNVMFESLDKATHEPLSSRISSKPYGLRIASSAHDFVQGFITSTAMGWRYTHHPTQTFFPICVLGTYSCTLVVLCGQGKVNTCVVIGLTNSLGSIIPCLAMRNVAASIAGSSTLRAKVLLCRFFIYFCSSHFTDRYSELGERSRNRWIYGGRLHSVSDK